MRLTRRRDLVVAALVAGAVAWALVRAFYGELPQLPWTGALTVLLLAVTELGVAGSVRARLQGRPRTRPIEPLVVARLAALAKASSVLGALTVGAWAGVALFLSQSLELRAARPDLVVSGLSAAAGVVLVVAALRLERACLVPGPPPASA